jgi:hypothetical protein
MMQKYIGRTLGIGQKCGDQIKKVFGVLVGCRENKVALRVSGLPEPVEFQIGRNRWVPFYLGPAIPATDDMLMEC